MKKFKKIYVEITNICNLDCDFCPKTSRLPKSMSVDEFYQTISSIAPYTGYVYFHLMGEPLTHPNLAEFFDVCFDKKLKVNLTTNGTLLSKNIEILQNAKSLRKITVSLHSFMANNKGALDLYVTDVLNSIALIKTINKNIIIEYRLWDNANILTEQIIKKILKYFNLEQLELGKSKVAENEYITTAEKFVWPTISNEKNEKLFCYGLRDQIGILSNGTVVPCCLDNNGENGLGNIFESSLENILSSAKAVEIFNGFSNRKAVTALCKKCSYAKRFK